MASIADIVEKVLVPDIVKPEKMKTKEIDFLTPTVLLENLRPGGCPFPFPDLECCGRPRAKGKNYCDHHNSIIYVPIVRKTKGIRPDFVFKKKNSSFKVKRMI
jgi:hypothetical protein